MNIFVQDWRFITHLTETVTLSFYIHAGIPAILHTHEEDQSENGGLFVGNWVETCPAQVAEPPQPHPIKAGCSLNGAFSTLLLRPTSTHKPSSKLSGRTEDFLVRKTIRWLRKIEARESRGRRKWSATGSMRMWGQLTSTGELQRGTPTERAAFSSSSRGDQHPRSSGLVWRRESTHGQRGFMAGYC